MDKSRKEAWDGYHRTGKNKSSHFLIDFDEFAAISGWDCARNEGRAQAFRDYHRTGQNNSEYDLNDWDRTESMLNQRLGKRRR